MHSGDVFKGASELVVCHAAHQLVKQTCLKLMCGCVSQEIQLLEPIPGCVFRCCVCVCHVLWFFCRFMMRVARVTACSMLLLLESIRLNSSQLTRGVGSVSHANLRRRCLVSSVMIQL